MIPIIITAAVSTLDYARWAKPWKCRFTSVEESLGLTITILPNPVMMMTWPLPFFKYFLSFGETTRKQAGFWGFLSLHISIFSSHQSVFQNNSGVPHSGWCSSAFTEWQRQENAAYFCFFFMEWQRRVPDKIIFKHCRLLIQMNKLKHDDL